MRPSLTIALFLTVGLGTSCSMLPTIKLPSLELPSFASPPPVKPAPQLMEVFEQKIASKLLANAPVVSRIRTLSESRRLIEDLKQLVNQSGLNPNLLTPDQRRRFKNAASQLQSLQFEVEHWTAKNHLADLKYLTRDEVELELDAALVAITQNLDDQLVAGASYPASIVRSALGQVRQLPKSSNAQALLNQLANLPLNPREGSSGVETWERNKLAPYFNDAGLVAALKQLELQAAQATQTRIRLEQDLGKTSETMYEDLHYDISREPGPEQLSLDIVSLHIEEAMRFNRLSRPILIKGVQSESAPLFDTEEDRVTINLESLTSLPAFEFQTLAYQAAGELLTEQHWAFSWRRTLALAYGRWTIDRMESEQYFLDAESILGQQIQSELLTHLGIIEIKLAQSEWTYQQAKNHLQEVTPYNKDQVDRWLTALLAEDGSYAAAALIARDFKNQRLIENKFEPLKQVSNLFDTKYPVSLSEFFDRISGVVAPADS